MIEVPLFFGAPDAALFGVLHRPAAPSTQPSVVFCHPFGEEKLWAHRTFVAYARHLATQGHTVLRFDYRGNGDSSGDFRDTSLTSAVADVQTAVEFLRENATGEVALLGLRYGASVASLVAEEMPSIAQLVLWAPIVDGARFMQELLRINLTTQMAMFKEIRQDRDQLATALARGESVNVDGYDMTSPMFEETSALALAKSTKRFAGRVLIVQVDRQERPSAELQLLAQQYTDATLAFAQEEPFWKEIARYYQDAPNLFARTDEWRRAATGAPDLRRP